MKETFKMAGDSMLIVNFSFVSATDVNMIYSPENMKLLNGKKKFYLVVSSLKITLRTNSYGVLTLTNLSAWLSDLKLWTELFCRGKSASFLFARRFRWSKRNSKGSEKKENSGGEQGLVILEFRGYREDEHFGIAKGNRGLKYSCPRGRVWIFSGITQYRATHLSLTEFEWFILFLYASFIEVQCITANIFSVKWVRFFVCTEPEFPKIYQRLPKTSDDFKRSPDRLPKITEGVERFSKGFPTNLEHEFRRCSDHFSNVKRIEFLLSLIGF